MYVHVHLCKTNTTCVCVLTLQWMRHVVQCLNPMLFHDWCCSLQQGKETQLLHVFEEDLILGSERTERSGETPECLHTGIHKINFSNKLF